jgi:hypothetical protein
MKNLNENTKQLELGRLLERSEHARRKTVVEAWKGSGYLYGLEGRDLGNMAVLAENQKRQVLRENNTTADMAVFDAIAIPMIRRQNALMVSPNLVSVQPLSYPNGVAFYLDYHVSNTKKPLRAAHFENDLSGGQADDFTGNTFESTSGYDRHYNNSGYDNTKGKIIYRGWNPATSNFNNTARGGANDTANAAAFTVNGVDLGTGAGVINIKVIEFDLSAVGGITMDQAATFEVADAAGTLIQNKDYFVQRVIQDYTDYILSSGRGPSAGPTSTLATAGNPQPNKKLRFRVIPTTDNLGPIDMRLTYREYLNLELAPAFSSELKLSVVQIPIQTQIHKMKTSWTVELAQDLMAYHAVDAEAELTQLLAEEVAAEKDRLIIRELINLAGHFEVWNADFAGAVDPNPANTVFRGTEATYNQTLVLAINRANAKIQKTTRRGGANWILISAEGAAKMINMDTFKATDADAEGTKFAAGVEQIGKVQGRYDVYVDPHLPAEICLVGRKGTSFFDTGYVYCPYIEYILSPVVLEDQDFNPRRMISSRFGTAMLNNKFYAVVWMKGIEKFEVYQADAGVPV